MDAFWSLLPTTSSRHSTTALTNSLTSQQPRYTVVRSTSRGSLPSLSATSGVWWRSSHSKAPSASGDGWPASLCFLTQDWRDSWRPYSSYSLVPQDNRTFFHGPPTTTTERLAPMRAAFSVLLCYTQQKKVREKLSQILNRGTNRQLMHINTTHMYIAVRELQL